MKKYTHIEKALGLAENQELAVDKLEGFYLNGPLAQQLDENLAEAEQTALTSEANIEALAKANETIASLNATIAENASKAAEAAKAMEEKDAKYAEAQTEISNLNAKMTELNAEIESLKQNAATATETASADSAAHEEALKAKDEEIENLKSQIAEKESEIQELSKNAPAAPVPAPAKQEEEEKMNVDAPHHFYKPGMTAEESRAALAKRKAQLRAKF